MTSLRSLDVSGCDIHDDALDMLLRRCPNLRILNSAEMKSLSYRFAQHEAAATLFSNLEEWNLSMCKMVNDAFLGAITHGCPKLRILNLATCTQVRDLTFEPRSSRTHSLLTCFLGW